MKTIANNPKFPASQKVYSLLLRAYPPAHRAEYGAAMAQLFRDQCRDAWREAGGWGLTKLWCRVLPDWASTSISERIAALNERKTMNDKLASLSRSRSTPRVIFMCVALAMFLLTIIMATTLTFVLPESFASTCKIKVENDQPNLPSATNSPSTGYDPYFIQTEFEIINSQLVLSNVIASLKLNEQWGKKYFNGETLKTTETMKILRGRMSLRPVRNTKLIAITVYSDDKNECALIANSVADSYRIYRLTKYRADHPDLDPRIPVSSLVQIVDPAEPARTPVKPNKTLNIVIGVVAGIFLGLMAGGAAALVAAKLGNRAPKNAPSA
jgi:capsular polysaccharide biosynthesis protein